MPFFFLSLLSCFNEKKNNTIDLNKKVSGTRTEYENVLKDLNKNQSVKNDIVKKIDKHNIRLSLNIEELDELEKQKYKIETKKNKILASLDALGTKESFYDELINAAEGYPKGVRDVLNNKKIYKGVLGAVGDIIKIDESISPSIELALGDYAKCVVVNNKKMQSVY